MTIRPKHKLAIMLCVVICAVVALSTVLVACNNDADPAKATSFVSVDINPSLELVLDQNNRVMSVASANTDAAVMLWNEDGIVGANLSDAMDRIGSIAVKMGYVTDENNNISVTVSASGSINPAALYDTIKTGLTSAINKADATINVNVEKAIDLALSKELEQLKAAHVGEEGFGDELTLERYRLIKRAMVYDRSLKLKDAVKMSNDALAQKVQTVQANVSTKLGQTYKLAAREAQFAYDSARQTLNDSLYSAYFIQQITKSPLSQIIDLGQKSVAGASYAANRAAYTALEHYYQALRDYLDNPIYTQSDAQKVFHAIATVAGGVSYEDFKAEITDENGDITKDAINAYINKLYRNIDENKRAELEQAYATVKQSVLDAYKFIGDIANADIEGEIDVIVNDQQTKISFSINSIASVLESAINSILGTITPAFDAIKNIAIDAKDALSVENALAQLQKNIDKAYEKMALTDEDIAAIKTMQNSVNASLEQAANTYNEAIKAAKDAAEKFLSEQKEIKIEANATITAPRLS